MSLGRMALLATGVAAAGVAASAPASRQVVTGPVAVYWMSAATTSGMAGMMGGGRPSMASIMAMRNGGGASYSHSLVLQLGSSQRPDGGAASAEHDPPQGLGVGPALALLSPPPATPPTHEEAAPGPPPQYHQPQGRMLIFWGCSSS